MPFLKTNGAVSYADTYEGDPGKIYYTAMSSFITAYARKVTITAIVNNLDRFIYADTDSIHLNGWDDPKDLFIHDSEFGAWKLEGFFEDSKFLRAKTYMEKMLGKWIEKDGEKIFKVASKVSDDLVGHWEVKCAGLREENKKDVTVNNFRLGATFKKLSSKTVPGGCVLVETDHQLKDVVGVVGAVPINYDEDLED